MIYLVQHEPGHPAVKGGDPGGSVDVLMLNLDGWRPGHPCGGGARDCDSCQRSLPEKAGWALPRSSPHPDSSASHSESFASFALTYGIWGHPHRFSGPAPGGPLAARASRDIGPLQARRAAGRSRPATPLRRALVEAGFGYIVSLRYSSFATERT